MNEEQLRAVLTRISLVTIDRIRFLIEERMKHVGTPGSEYNLACYHVLRELQELEDDLRLHEEGGEEPGGPDAD